MILHVEKPGMLTTVQDLGRWGYQSSGVPVCGACDPYSMQIANRMLGNTRGAAALEITVMGPQLRAEGCGTFVCAGGNLGMRINGQSASPWVVHYLSQDDVISFTGPKDGTCRAILCFCGGLCVPPVMGSMSTYTRGKMGGYEGRALAAGDRLRCGEPDALWNFSAQLVYYDWLAAQDADTLPVMSGPQADMFTPEGVETFYGSDYTISAEADRMGYRMEGPAVAHKAGADIVSDAICLGAIQVPGHGQPIAMMADRQTTGGYTKIGVLTGIASARLMRMMPGQRIRFKKTTEHEAIGAIKSFEAAIAQVDAARATYRTR